MFRLAAPDIDEEDIEAVIKVLRSGFLIAGENVLRFEQMLAEYLQVRNIVVVSSGTAALHIALLTAGIGHGDVVIVPDFTFPATANAVELTGAQVLLCDVDNQTYNITPACLQDAIESYSGKGHLRAIMPVHEFGCPANLDEIYALAKKHNLIVIEDAACALGAEYKHNKIGHVADMACFSLHPRKALTTGEGGFISTNNDEWAQRMRLLRNHGMKKEKDGMQFVVAGLNYRLTDFQAALGIGQLTRFNEWTLQRRSLINGYFENLKNCPHLSLPQNVQGHSWQTFMAVLDEKIDRAKLIEKLRAREIETNLGAYSLHVQPYYKEKYPALRDGLCPTSLNLYKHGLALPFHHKLTKASIKQISNTLCEELSKIN